MPVLTAAICRRVVDAGDVTDARWLEIRRSQRMAVLRYVAQNARIREQRMAKIQAGPTRLLQAPRGTSLNLKGRKL
jgi:hypothetical protein